jgi:hypothetical protein
MAERPRGEHAPLRQQLRSYVVQRLYEFHRMCSSVRRAI